MSQCRCRRGELFCKVHVLPSLAASHSFLIRYPHLYRSESTSDTSISSVTTHQRADRRTATMDDALASLRMHPHTTRVFWSETRAKMCASRDVESRHEITVISIIAAKLLCKMSLTDQPPMPTLSLGMVVSPDNTPRWRTNLCRNTSVRSTDSASFFVNDTWLEQHYGHIRVPCVVVVVVVVVV